MNQRACEHNYACAGAGSTAALRDTPRSPHSNPSLTNDVMASDSYEGEGEYIESIRNVGGSIECESGGIESVDVKGESNEHEGGGNIPEQRHTPLSPEQWLAKKWYLLAHKMRFPLPEVRQQFYPSVMGANFRWVRPDNMLPTPCPRCGGPSGFRHREWQDVMEECMTCCSAFP